MFAASATAIAILALPLAASAGLIYESSRAPWLPVPEARSYSAATFALEASIGNFAGGAETLLIYNLGAVNTVPEPGTLALLGWASLASA